jgi:hypothetical protein
MSISKKWDRRLRSVMWMSASVYLARPDQGRRGVSRLPAKPQGAQLLVRRVVLLRGQSPEALDSVLQLELPEEPR